MNTPLDKLTSVLSRSFVHQLAGGASLALVNDWRHGLSTPDPLALRRFTVGLSCYQAVAMATSTGIAKLWFEGSNPSLDGRQPLAVLAATTKCDDPDFDAVEEAARRCAENHILR